MAGELYAALAQIKVDVAAITGVQVAHLGQALTAIANATATKAEAAVYVTRGGPMSDTYKSTTEVHVVEVKFYWLLTPANVEVVEQATAEMWDLVMAKFFGSDPDRNLSEKCTIALVAGENGREQYMAGYEEVGGKIHRVLIVPIEVTLDTHAIA